MAEMLEEVMPYLYRPLQDDELRLGAALINGLMEVPGLSDTKGELAIACCVALYLDHRAKMSDGQAEQRMLHNIRQIRASGQLQLATGAQMTPHAIQVVQNYRRKGLL